MPASPLLPAQSPARKVVAVLLLVLVLVALVQWVARPVLGAFEARRGEVATLTGQLGALRRVADSRPREEERLMRLRQRREVEGLTFDAPNPSRAAGLLQQHVTQLINAAGGRVTSIQVLPGEERGGIVRMTARVTASASAETLGPVLYALESSVPYLVVSKFTTTGRGHGFAARGPAGVSPLTVGMDVTGFLAVDDVEGS